MVTIIIGLKFISSRVGVIVGTKKNHLNNDALMNVKTYVLHNTFVSANQKVGLIQICLNVQLKVYWVCLIQPTQ